MFEQPNHNTQPDLPDPEPPSTPGALKGSVRHRPSFGERVVDITNFGGLGYIANGAISLYLLRKTNHLTNTRLSQVGHWTRNKFNHLFESVGASSTKANKLSELWSDILILGSGGWLMLLPMRWIEERRFAFARKIDEALGTGPKAPEAIHAQKQALESGPKQDYPSLITGRVLSYSATIALALPFITKVTPVNAVFSKFLNQHIGPHLGTLKHPLVEGSNIPKFVDGLSKEIILAGTAAGLHYVSSKSFADIAYKLRLANDNETRSVVAPGTQVRDAKHQEQTIPPPKPEIGGKAA